MNRRLLILLTLAVVIIGAVVAVGMASRVPTAVTKAPHVANLKVGDAAPPFQVSSTAGFIDSTQVKKPMMVEMFATWCPHCRRSVPIMNDIFHTYGSRMQFIAISASAIGQDEQSPETQADVVNFAQTLNVQYPVAFDADLAVADKYLMQGYPTIVVIDANQKIASTSTGEQTQEQLVKRIKAVLP